MKNEDKKDNKIFVSILNKKRHHITDKLLKPCTVTFPLIALIDHATHQTPTFSISHQSKYNCFEKEIIKEFKISILLGWNHIIAKPMLLSE